MAVPCGYQYTAFDGTVQEINDDNCNWDKDALGDYLGGNAIFNVFANQVSFDINNFSESKTKMGTSIKSSMFNTKDAAWVGTYIKRNEIIDEISLLQLG